MRCCFRGCVYFGGGCSSDISSPSLRMAFNSLRCLRLQDNDTNEDDAVKEYMHQLLTNFNSIRSSTSCKSTSHPLPFWDLVVISARDEEQQAAFELQIENKLSQKELPRDLSYIVLSDPDGKKIGNGGSTLHVLEQLQARFGDELFEMRTLLIHAGGSSQRLPTASVLGKLFTPLPLGEPMYQMLDLKLALYLPFLKRMAPGVLVTCSDDIESYWLDKDENAPVWSFDEQGFVALAHKSDVETGQQHGVYVLPFANFDLEAVVTFGECLQVLQKPSHVTMDLKGAIIEGFGVCTDSVFYFSKDIISKFLDFYKSVKPLECEIDAYNDFLQALGTNANMDYIHNARNKSMASKTLTSLRQKIYLLLHNSPLNILLLHWSRFYHLGTCTEYIDNLTFNSGKRNLFQDLGFTNWRCSKEIVDDETSSSTNDNAQSRLPLSKKYPNLTVLHSIISRSLECSGAGVIEYCNLQASVSLGEKCLLSYCTVKCTTPLIIPSHSCIHTIPVNHEGKSGFVTVAFGIEDDLKLNYSTFEANNILYFGKRLGSLLNQIGVKNVLELFDERVRKCNLWNAKLFLLCNDPTTSFLTTVNHLLLISGQKELIPKCNLNFEEGSQEEKEEIRLSMLDVLKCNDIKMMLRLKQDLYQQIVN